MFQGVINGVSAIAIPLLILAIVGHGWYKKVKVYEVFTEGAKEGFTVAVRIIPFLVAILVAIGAFRASGALDLITGLLGPLTSWIGMPGEVIPMALMRPLSGSGALGIVSELINTYGVDSLLPVWQLSWKAPLKQPSIFWLCRGQENPSCPPSSASS